MVISNNKEEASLMKTAYEKQMKKEGIDIKHQKDMHYKKPFWKFWSFDGYSIAVYKMQMFNPL